MPTSTIKCPHCSNDIDVNDVLYHQMEIEFKNKMISAQKKFDEEVQSKRDEYKKVFEQLTMQQKEIENNKKELASKIEEGVKVELKAQKRVLEESLRKEIFDEQNEAIISLQKELENKSNQIKELNHAKIEIEKLKREKDEIESKIKAEAELTISNEVKISKERIQKELNSQNELRFKEKDNQLQALTKQLQEAHRKAELGSQQLQGETQELAIEEFLTTAFAYDTITEISKGSRGGDAIQIVNTRNYINCGKIYYESKRTKEFKNEWIDKFKSDIIEAGADVGILVTKSYPKDINRMTLFNGIWICSFEEFKSLSYIIRENIINLYTVKINNENRSDKMNILYNYLTSNEFKLQVESIVESFSTMKQDLDKEKRAFTKIWNQREKQIEKVLNSTISMYGSIKGIAGNAIADIKSLELPYDDLEDIIDEN